MLGRINQKGNKIRGSKSDRERLYPYFSQGQRIPVEAASFMVVDCCNEPSGPREGSVGYRGRGSTKKVELLQGGLENTREQFTFFMMLCALGPTLLWLLWMGTKKGKAWFLVAIRGGTRWLESRRDVLWQFFFTT